MTLEQFVGNADAVRLVRRSITEERLSHAYLISGPRGVGRRTLALEIAKALNCQASASEARPCDACRACRLINRGVHPDVRLVRRAPDRKAILLRAQPGTPANRDYADNVEFIQADAQLRPADGRRKVYIILNAEELSTEAANRLLKSIEEPTPYVHFLLTSRDRGSVLPTIVSRCQEIRLRPVNSEAITAALMARQATSPERTEVLAGISNGAPGWALAAASDADAALILRQQDIRDLRAALAANRVERLALSRALSERWASQPEAVRDTLRAWVAWWRDVLLTQVGLGNRIVHREPALQGTLTAAAVGVEHSAARAALARTRQTLIDLDANVNARLALDLLLLKLPELSPQT